MKASQDKSLRMKESDVMASREERAEVNMKMKRQVASFIGHSPYPLPLAARVSHTKSTSNLFTLNIFET